MSKPKKSKDLKKEEKQNIREFSRLNKTELIEIIYKLEDLNLSIKSRNVELERMLEERGGLILSLNNSIETLKNASNRPPSNNISNTKRIHQDKNSNKAISQALWVIFINTLITSIIVRKLNKKKKNIKKVENDDIKKSLHSLLKKTRKAINKLIL